MERYEFIWRDGSRNVGDGNTPEEALSALGFSCGAIPALDYWKKLEAEDDARTENSADPAE